MASSSKSKGMDHLKLGLRQYREGKYVEAISSFDKAITLGHKTFVVYDGKAAAMAKLEDWRESAYRHTDKMIEKFKNDTYICRAYYRKADILRLMRSHTAALNVISQAIPLLDRIPPSDRPKHSTLLSTLRERIETERNAAKRQKIREQTRDAVEYQARMEKLQAQEAKAKINFVQLLPRDVLVNICEIGLVDDEWFGMKMGRVCSAWRYAVMSQQGLWGSLSIGKIRPVQKARYWIEKSRGRIIELKIEEDFDTAKEISVGLVLEKALAGIKLLEIRCRLRIIYDGWQGMFKSLERFVIDTSPLAYYNIDGVSKDPTHRLDYGLCPYSSATLRHVHTSKGDFKIGMGGPDTGEVVTDSPDARSAEDFRNDDRYLASIRTLHMEAMFITTKGSFRSSFFRSFPHLQEIRLLHCTFTGSSASDAAALVPDERFELDNLAIYAQDHFRHIGVNGIRQVALDEFIHTPNLRELSFWSASGLIQRQLLAPCMIDAMPKLTALDIGKTTINQVDFLAEVLPRLASLRFLNVSYCDLDDEFLQAISHRDGLDPTDQLLPNLTALSIAASGTITTVAVRDFVNSRLPLEERFVVRKAKAEPPKVSGAFRPTAPAKLSKSSAAISSSGTGRSGIARVNSRNKGDLGGLFAPGIVVSQPSLSSMKPSSTKSSTTSMPKEISTGPQKAGISEANAVHAAAPLDEIPTLTQSFFATQPLTPRTFRPRISWLNLDACDRLDRDLLPLLETKVAFVSWWLGSTVEERIRGTGRWRWDKEVVECGKEEKCHLVPVPGQRGSFHILHTCNRAMAEEDTDGEAVSEPGWRIVKKEDGK